MKTMNEYKVNQIEKAKADYDELSDKYTRMIACSITAVSAFLYIFLMPEKKPDRAPESDIVGRITARHLREVALLASLSRTREIHGERK